MSIRVAVIGTGVMGSKHARVYSQMPGVSLEAVCDIDDKTGREVAKSHNTKYYSDHRKLIEKEHPDAVSIVVPTKYHKKVALDFIESGVNVLIEKPLAPTVKDCEELIGKAKSSKVTLMVGHIERFNPAVSKLQELIHSGVFGDVLSIVVKRVGLFPPRINDVNVVTDLAVHDLDVISKILGGLPVNVFARGGNGIIENREDHGEIFMDYGRFGCFVQVNWVTHIKIRTLSLTGTKGYAELNYITQKLDLYKSQHANNQQEDFKDFVTNFGEPEKMEVEVKPDEPLRLELENFIESIRSCHLPKVTGIDGLNAVLLSEAVNESIKTGQLIQIKTP